MDNGRDEALAGSLRPLVQKAVAEARMRGAATVEAEHFLLALAATRRGAAAVILDEVGLDHAGIVNALKEERNRSLAAVGVTAGLAEDLKPTQRETRPGWGASAREALMHVRRHGGADSRRHRLDELDLLRGILSAHYGTVPRALAIAGIDRLSLLDRVGDFAT